ncbi:MAG: nodulation protein NfeD [Deltaproteobacteria bacterium]|nr:nodulation protein NfeD [Deltaproteobacteria bacterium]
MKKSVLFLLTLAAPVFFSLASASFAKEIHYVKTEGIVNPVMAEFLVKAVKDAEESKAEALIIQLDTPGGLDLSMRDIVKAILSSNVPVVVYVAPAGSRAASAGVFIAYAANVAAMAPGTNIGSAHPVTLGGGGEKPDATMMKKVENDAAAYIKGIALKRGRNAEWAEKAVRESVNITAEDALKLGVINFVAENREALLLKLDGMKTETVSGPRLIAAKGAVIVESEMNWRSRVLSAVTNPNVAYILLMIGLIGLYFELSNPGAVLPGVIGAVCLVLAFYSLQTLSVNYAGLLLIALAVIFFILELKVVSYGLLTVAGIISLILGSLMLFDSPEPFMRVSVWVVMPTVAFMTIFIIGTMYYALRIHKKKPISGVEGIIKSTGVVSDDFVDGTGKIFMEGEYWDAVSAEPLKKGDRARVLEVKGLVAKVEKEKSSF